MRIRFFERVVLALGVAYTLKLLFNLNYDVDVKLILCFGLSLGINYLSYKLDKFGVDSVQLTYTGFGIVGIVFGLVKLFTVL